jgi:hypothetical protein
VRRATGQLPARAGSGHARHSRRHAETLRGTRAERAQGLSPRNPVTHLRDRDEPSARVVPGVRSEPGRWAHTLPEDARQG